MNKKIIITLLILTTIMFNLNPLVKANSEIKLASSPEALNQQYKDGTATLHSDGDSEKKSEVIGTENTPSQKSTLANVLSILLSIIPWTANKLLAVVALHSEDIIEYNGEDISLFTIEGLLTNKYPLFDINLFENIEEGPNATFSNTIKKNAALWYVGIRNLAIIGFAITILYVGIRLAIATTAEDSAKYKKMLTSWLIGIILLFVIHYIVLIMIKVSNIFIDFIKSAIESDTETVSMELEVLTHVFKKIGSIEGWEKLYYVALYMVLTFYEIKFFIMYLYRVFRIFIMMVISPLICMTYPIDAVGDGRAQGFNNWFKRIMMEIFIQPIHLIIYVIFIYSAGEIAKTVPLVAICFLIALDNGEKVIRSALKISGKGLKDIKLGLGKGK